jgi:CMP/dCMP kinase
MDRSIVINREFGSGGREVGRIVAERTGMEFYDTRILQEAAARQGSPTDLLASFDEQVVGGQFFDVSMLGTADAELLSLPYRTYSTIAEVIVAAAQRAPAVFIGRCADRILVDHGLRMRSVFIYSTDRQAKIARAIEVDGIEPKYAESHINRMDRSRRRYQQFFTDTKFGDPHSYDLCLNSARLSYRDCADVILASC